MGNIVFVGAGGTGVSGLIGMLWDLGFRNLVAIDSVESELTDRLQKMGVSFFLGHGKYEVNIEDHLIYSAACEGSLEVEKAKSYKRTNKQQRLVVNYFEFLGEISKYFQTIGVMGTNGKSSTTAMLLSVAKDVVPDFGLGILGALVPDLGNKNYVIADSKKDAIKTIFDYIFTGKGLDYELVKKYFFIVEACEYKRHFLNLDMDWAILTSLELDHTDYFRDMDDYTSAYEQVLNRLRYRCFALEDYGFTREKITKVAREDFDFQYIFGDFQSGNASLVKALLSTIMEKNNFDEKVITHTIEYFHGLWRRMELLATTPKGTKVFSDYGHVASSIQLGKTTLQQHFPNKHISVIFQPHQITRIVNNWDLFPQAFEGYNHSVIFDIYAARESLDLVEKLGISNVKTKSDLGNALAKAVEGSYTEDFNTIVEYITHLGKNDIVVVYTAGDLDYLLRKELKKIVY